MRRLPSHPLLRAARSRRWLVLFLSLALALAVAVPSVAAREGDEPSPEPAAQEAAPTGTEDTATEAAGSAG